MTEYDYSPDAIERYMEKQNSVARWIDRQAQEARNYGNPLVPEEYSSSPSPSRSNSGGGGRGASLPRSVSTPPDPRHQRGQAHAPAYGHASGHGYAHRSGHSSHRSHSSSNSASTATLVQPQPQPHRYSSPLGGSSHSRSHSTSQTAVYSSSGGSRRPPPTRSRTYATAMASMNAMHLPQHSGRGSTRSQTLPAPTQPQFTGAPGQTVVMHNGRQTYVVVPPHGARVQVCSPQSTSPTYPTPQNYVPAHYPYAQPVSPTRESNSSKKAPLLKRIFGFPNSQNSGNSGHADYYARRGGNNVPVMTTAGARRRTTSMHY
ncbi:hypothetical protein ACEPAF_5461 [Sanghuangporus sanghuang]